MNRLPQHALGTITLASSLVHGGDETLGITKLARTKGWIFEGRKVKVPIISGNSLRGLWRRAAAEAFMDAYLAAGGDKLSLSAFYYLTSGGSLKKGGDGGAMDLAGETELRRLIPHVGLFGGAGMGRLQAGKLYVDEAIPVCIETLPILKRMWPEVEKLETARLSVRDLIEVHGYSRMDDAKQAHWRRYLDDGGNDAAVALIKATETSDVADDPGRPQQMRYEQVELVAGTVLFHRWGFRHTPTPEEEAGLVAGLMRWGARPHAGGRNAIGHGNIIPSYQGATPDVRLLTDGKDALATAESAATTLQEHVTQNLDGIRKALAAI